MFRYTVTMYRLAAYLRKSGWTRWEVARRLITGRLI